MENAGTSLKLRLTKTVVIGAVAVILIAIIMAVIFSGSGKVTIDVETALKEMILSSELRTAEYTYNSIVEVKDEKSQKTKYHALYKGTVKAGFDFENVEIVRDENKILIVVPKVEIVEVVVNPELDFIFEKKRYDGEQTYAEATAACKSDLLKKAQTNETLLKTAKESAKDTLEALIKPFEAHLGEDESFEIVFSDEKGVGMQ